MAPIHELYPPKLSENQLEYLLSSIKDWTLAHGLAVRPSSGLVLGTDDRNWVLAVPAPVTLFPSLFPRRCFEQALGVQKAYNELYAYISREETWLGNVIQE